MIHVDSGDLVPDNESGWSPVGPRHGDRELSGSQEGGAPRKHPNGTDEGRATQREDVPKEEPRLLHDPTLDQSFDEGQVEAYKGPPASGRPEGQSRRRRRSVFPARPFRRK